MLNISEGLDDLGPINWELALCLFLAWTAVALVLVKGLKSFGKVSTNTVFEQNTIF